MSKIGIGDQAPDFELAGTGGAHLPARGLPRPLGRPRLLPGRLHARLHAPVLLLPRRRRPPRRPRRRRARDLAAVGRLARALRRASTSSPCRCSPTPTTRPSRAYGVVAPGRAGPPLDLHRRPRGHRPLPPRRPARPPLQGRRAPRRGAVAGARRRALAPSESREPAEPFTVAGPAVAAARGGAGGGGGPPIVLLHGLTATRRYVVHGSQALPRQGFRTIAYDARGHGESDPAPAGAGYAYDELAADLGGGARRAGRRSALRARRPLDGRAHAHRPRARRPRPGRGRWSLIGPGLPRQPADRGEPRLLGRARRRARAGRASRASSPPTTAVSTPTGARRCCGSPATGSASTATPRRSRGRCARCRARSPFDDLAELEFLDLPALVVASHDEADPGHPYAVAEAWARAAAAGDADQRGAGRVAARLAGRPALARDRRLLRAPGGRGAALAR